MLVSNPYSSTTATAITSVINNNSTEAEQTCYHQCHVCGIISNCDETRQNCTPVL
jgi:hypothetical protein